MDESDPESRIAALLEPVNLRAMMAAAGTLPPPTGTELLALDAAIPADDLLTHLARESKLLEEFRARLAAMPKMDHPTDAAFFMTGSCAIVVARLDQVIADLRRFRYAVQEYFVLKGTTEEGAP